MTDKEAMQALIDGEKLCEKEDSGIFEYILLDKNGKIVTESGVPFDFLVGEDLQIYESKEEKIKRLARDSRSNLSEGGRYITPVRELLNLILEEES